MATIIRSSSPVQGQQGINDANVLIANYWATETEHVFSTSFWKIKQLLVAADSGEIALRVTDIDNEDFVDAEWIVFGDGMDQFLQGDVREGEYYFVINENEFKEIEDGISPLQGLEEVLIITRLAKETPDGDGDYTIFMLSARYEFLGGVGGGTNGAGIKVPRNQ